MKAWLKKRQTKYGAYVAVYVLIVAAILAAANYLAERYNKSFDATSNKIFSLSDQTRKVVSNLKTNVRIWYFDQGSRFDESRFGPSPRDLLGRYQSLSRRVSVEYIDPVRNPKKALDMKVNVLGAIIVEVDGRRQEAKSLSEEQVTNALIRALKPDKRTACFLTGHGERNPEDTGSAGFASAKEALEASNYATRDISLLEKEPAVPADCKVLVVAGPRKDLIEVETQAIRKYVEGGGSALFLLDPPTPNVTTAALVKTLDEWGVKVNNNIVVDPSGAGRFFAAAALSPRVAKYESHPITREMSNVDTLFPITRSVAPGAYKDKVSVEKLFSTTPASFATSDFSSEGIKLDPKKDTPGPHSLAVAGRYRTGKEGSEGRFVVAGTSRFASNASLSFPPGNRDLFLNMMSWLSSDEDLISIRPRNPEDRRLSLSAAQMGRIFYTSVVIFPLLIIAGGTYVWWRRR